MTVEGVIGIISGLIVLAAYFPYIASLVRGQTKAHPVSWILWSILGGIFLSTYVAAGGKEAVWVVAVNFFGPAVVMILSIKYWRGGFSRFDYACLVLSLSSLLLWLVSGSAVLAMTWNMLADLIAAMPTLVKVYKDPKSEDYVFWSLVTVADFMNIIAVGEWNYGTAVLPIYLFLFAGSVACLSLRGRWFNVKTP